MSCYGYKKSGGMQLISNHRQSIGLSFKDFKVGFAAMADMWTEEHSSLRGLGKNKVLNFYQNRYTGARGIPKRPGYFDPNFAFLDRAQYRDLLNSPLDIDQPLIIDEIICDRWKLDKIYVPKSYPNKESIQNVLDKYNYDYKKIVIEY